MSKSESPQPRLKRAYSVCTSATLLSWIMFICYKIMIQKDYSEHSKT